MYSIVVRYYSSNEGRKGKDTVMKNSSVLRLVWENINGDVCEHEMPMLEWVLDWWGACEIVPANDDLVYLAELDGQRFFENGDGEAFETVFGKAFLAWEALPSLLKSRSAA